MKDAFHALGLIIDLVGYAAVAGIVFGPFIAFFMHRSPARLRFRRALTSLLFFMLLFWASAVSKVFYQAYYVAHIQVRHGKGLTSLTFDNNKSMTKEVLGNVATNYT